MGVVFFGFAVLALLLGSIGLLILGVVLRAALKRRAQAGGRWAMRIRRLAVPAIVIGAIGMVLPLGFLGFVAYVNATPPADFVETGIDIEEEGYQLEQFTAGGVTYRRLLFHSAGEHGEPVFTYKEEGWYNASSWGNYYRVENGIGCDLVCDRHGGLFCPEDQYDRVVEAYESAREMDSVWLANGNEIDVSDELRAAFRGVQALEGMGQKLLLDRDGFRMLTIAEFSFDGVVLHGSIPLLCTSKGIYLEQTAQSHGDGRLSFRALPLPDELQIMLKDALRIYL